MEESQDMYDDGSGITMMMITTTMPQKNLWMAQDIAKFGLHCLSDVIFVHA